MANETEFEPDFESELLRLDTFSSENNNDKGLDDLIQSLFIFGEQVTLKPDQNEKIEETNKTSITRHFLNIIKNENYQMAKNIIDNDNVFNGLNNKYRLILSTLLTQDSDSGQEYISKILDNSNDDFIIFFAKNKALFKKLSRENKNIVIKRLHLNPWLFSDKEKENTENLNEKIIPHFQTFSEDPRPKKKKSPIDSFFEF